MEPESAPLLATPNLDTKHIEEQILTITKLKNGNCDVVSKPLDQRKKGYRRYPDGGIECYNRDEIRA
jgi:hypothetical protein